jgi:hypothetical protein
MDVFDVVERLQGLMTAPDFAKLMMYAEQRDEAKLGDDGDVWAGSGLIDMTEVERRSTIMLQFSTDSAVFQQTLSVSATPVVAEILNLPPGLRQRFGSMLVFGVIPAAGNYHELFTQLLQHNAKYFKGGVDADGVIRDDGFLVDDVFAVVTPGSKPVKRSVHLDIAKILNDSRGLQPDLCCKQSPAICGGCPFCWVKGFNIGKTLYPSAVSFLPRTDPIRQNFINTLVVESELVEEEEEPPIPLPANLSAAEVLEAATIQKSKRKTRKRREKARECAAHITALCKSSAPALMTTEEAISAGKRVLDGISRREDEPYFNISPYLKLNPSLDLLRLACNDPAHALANLAKQILKLISSTGKMNATAAAMEFERLMGRFREVESSRAIPFQASKLRGLEVEAVIRYLKSPQGWAKIRYYFSNPSNMKLVELLRVISDTGVYFITLLDLEEKYTILFIELIQATEFLLYKEPMLPQDFQEATLRLYQSLATCEMMLPLFWNHIVVHLLLHEPMFIERFGVFTVRSMLSVEMMHTTLKSYANSGSRNFMMTLAKTYLQRCKTELARFDKRAMPQEAPAASIASVRPDPRRPHKKITIPLGKVSQVKQLSPLQFRQTLEAWGRLHAIFDKQILDKYKAFITVDGPRKKRTRDTYWNAASWREWFDQAAKRSRPTWTKEMLRFKNIEDTARFYTRAELDDTVFATAQHCSKQKYDNSYVEEKYNTWPNGRNRDPVEVTCYNRIIEIFTHYAPFFISEEVVHEYREFLSWLLDLDTELINVAAEGEEVKNVTVPVCSTIEVGYLLDLKSGTQPEYWTTPGMYRCHLCESDSATPHEWYMHTIAEAHLKQLNKPWSRKIFLDHDVYTPVPSEPVNPINKLPNVSRDLELEKGARLSFLDQMCAHNIVLWPRDPWADKKQPLEKVEWTVIRGRDLDYGLSPH